MLHHSFKPAKCKTSLRLAVARIKLLRNKREVQVKQMKREMAQLLESGQEQTARIRVEHVIREEKTMSAYELIELYCELIVARLPIIESQKSCPIDLKEAVSSVIFASPRCADVPELMDIRKHFTAKYGKEFIHAALEVRPDCGVSRLVVEKLSARAPDTVTKVKTLTSIAEEHNVKWDPKAFEEQLQKPHDDLLNGPTSFASASNMPRESSSVKSSPASDQTNESMMKIMPQNATSSQPTMATNFSETNTMPGPSVPFTSQSDSKSSERRSGDREVSNSHAGHASMNQSAWNMEFQDATSAAQAAAESAERASMAARAAAEIASRESMSRKNSSGLDESQTYATKYDRPEHLRVLLDEQIADEHVPKGNDEIKNSQGMKTVMQNRQQGERAHGIAVRGEAARTSKNDYRNGGETHSQSSLNSGQSCVDDDILDIDLHKDDTKDHSHVQMISSESESEEHNHLYMKYENVESSRENTNANSNKAASSHHVTDDEKIWNSDIFGHENDAGEGIFERSHKQSISSDSFNVAFDNYGSDAEDNNSVCGRNRRNLLDSYQGEEPSSHESTKGLFSIDQNRSGSFDKNKGSQQHLFTESQPEEHSKAMAKLTSPSESNEILPPAFDASDGEGISSDDEVANYTHNGAKTPSNFLHDQRCSTESSHSDESESKHIFMVERKGVDETIRYSGVYEEKTDLYAADKPSKRSNLSSFPGSQPSPRSEKAPSNSNISVGGPNYSSSEEEPPPLRLSKRGPTREAEAKETSMQLGSESSEVSNEFSDERGIGLNFGRLTGGFKHRGFPHPPYVRSSATDHARSSAQTSDSIPITEKPIVPDLDKLSSSVEVTDQDRYNQASLFKSYATKSRASEAYAGSTSDTAEGLATGYSGEDTPDIDERHFVSDRATITENVGATAQESYHQRLHQKGHKAVGSNFHGAYDDPDITEQSRYANDSSNSRESAYMPQKQNSDASLAIDKLTSSFPDKTYASSEDINLEPYVQKPHLKANKDSSSKLTNLDSDCSEPKLDSNRTDGRRVKLSRRTRDVPSDFENSSSRVTDPFPNTSYDAVTIQEKRNRKPIQSNLSVEQPPVAPKQISAHEDSMKLQHDAVDNLVPTHDGKIKSSSSTGESVSSENSINKASHAHPKLPDYESLAAHFHSLRSNRR